MRASGIVTKHLLGGFPRQGGGALAVLVFGVLAPLFFVSCATGPVPVDRGKTVAVWDLENLTPGEGGLPDFGEALSARVIETIREKDDYTVVERERLVLVLEELNLGTTALVDESTRLQLGRMVGARFMVFGGYQVIARQMRVDLRLVEVETGKITQTAQRTITGTNLMMWLDATGDAAQDLF